MHQLPYAGKLSKNLFQASQISTAYFLITLSKQTTFNKWKFFDYPPYNKPDVKCILQVHGFAKKKFENSLLYFPSTPLTVHANKVGKI